MINKFLISLLAFLCIIDTADAVDFGTPDINENGITEEELKTAYVNKYEKNMKRW